MLIYFRWPEFICLISLLFFQSFIDIIFECSGFQGLFGGILGPTLLDLQTRTDANKEEIAQAFIGKNVGSIAGSVFSGFLYEVFLKQTGTNVLAAATYQSKMSNN